MGGHVTFPGFAMYHATKWGIEGFIEALGKEIAGFGIHTLLVEPGMVRTSFYDAAGRVPASEPYRGGPTDRDPIPLDQMPGSQSGVAHAIIEAASSDAPPKRLLLNSDAYEPSPPAFASDSATSNDSGRRPTRRTSSTPWGHRTEGRPSRRCAATGSAPRRKLSHCGRCARFAC